MGDGVNPQFQIDPTSKCYSKSVGKGTRIWSWVNISEDVTIGEDCNVCDHVFIERNVTIGNRVTIKNGVQLFEGMNVCDDVFIGPNATFANDNYPRSKVFQENIPATLLSKGCSIGANATVLAGLVIGVNSIVGAGSVVTRDVPDNVVVAGNPARILRKI